MITAAPQRMQIPFHNTMASQNVHAATPAGGGPFSASLEKVNITDPSHTDVLLGRGVATNRHPGNENFRDIVSQHVDVYVTSTKKQKMMISRSIVDKVRTELVPPGRFLEKDPGTGLWSEVGDKKALEKTAQALRDGAAPLRKQLSEDMSDPTFLAAVFDDNSELASKPKPVIAKGHRRMNTAPVGCPTLPTMSLPDPKRSKPNSPVYSPADNSFLESIAANNLMVDNTTLSPYATVPQFNVALSPDTNQSLVPNASRRSPVSPKPGRQQPKRGKHRRLRTFGGYSCSDNADMQDFLSKEDLMEGIPPLFASQLPNQPAPPQVAHAMAPTPMAPHNLPPLHPSTATMNYNSPAPVAAFDVPVAAPAPVVQISHNRHRRHQTMGGIAFTQASPVFSDDPNLNFDFGQCFTDPGPSYRNNTNTLTEPDPQDPPPQDFSMLNLEIPELPLTRPPVTTSGRGRHRRMHTTGQVSLGGAKKVNPTFNLDSLGLLPLEPLHEEKQYQDPNALDDLMSSIEPLDHRPQRHSSTESHNTRSSLTDEDFLKLANDVDFDIGKGLDVLREESSLSMDEESNGVHHLIGDCESGSNLGRSGSFVKREDSMQTSSDTDFDAAMGVDEHFLQLASSEPVDIDDDLFLGNVKSG